MFVDGGRRIEILNANVTAAERHLGVDLIYYLASEGGFVFVQYKKLVKDRTAVDARFLSQLDRMRQVATLGAAPRQPRDYRLGPRTSCFVKLAQAREFDPAADSLMQGMYLPLDFLDLLLADESVAGERGGLSLSYDNVGRHLTNTQFISLLSAGWVGSTGVSREQLFQIGAESLRSGRSLVLAADSGVRVRRRHRSTRQQR